MTAMRTLSLSVQYASNARKLPTRTQFRRWVKIAQEQDVQIALRVVNEAEGRALNRSYRGKDYATNVLTFVYDDMPSLPQSAGPAGNALQALSLHGDIVLCAPVVAREAREQGKDLLAHYAHLTIHAVLHLQGYDHKKKRDAERMEARETALLLELRYPAPYLIR